MIDSFGDLQTILKLRKFIERLLEGDFVWMNPLFWPVLGWGFTAALTFGTTLWPPMHPGIAIPLFVLAIALPIIGLLANFVFYPINEKYLRRLVLLYLSLMFIFANIYFLFLLLLDDGTIPFDGIHKVWTWLEGTQGRVIHTEDTLLGITDCIHFSIASITALDTAIEKAIDVAAKQYLN